MNRSDLPPLPSFSPVPQPEPEVFGAALSDISVREVVLFCNEERQDGADIYARVTGIRKKCHLVVSADELPYDEIDALKTPGTVPLVVDSAINPQLKDSFFLHPEIAAFVDHNYIPAGQHSSPELQTVGTTPHGLLQLPKQGADIQTLRSYRCRCMREVLGDDIFTYGDFRSMLHSPALQSIRLHGLGPKGTNIAQACDLYLRDRRLLQSGNGHAAIPVIHGKGVEPFEYAEMAKEEQEDGVLPLHMECAVFYGMRDLYRQRMNEMVFADHQYMPLDEMQLAGLPESSNGNGHPLRVASHPSPLRLVDPLLQHGAQYVKASSNSAAAAMVRDGDADVCITTESGRGEYDLAKLHSFGSPMMLFTIGTPYDATSLKRYTQK